MRTIHATTADVVREQAQLLQGNDQDFDALLHRIGNAHYVLIGEASHGTHEFYRLRAQLTKRLIREKNFCAVVVEADWPDAYRVNRFVRGRSDDADSIDALADFKRFPAWMWRNADVLDFIGWLREHNARNGMPCGFYGLDLYSLFGSIQVVIEFLNKADPTGAQRAKERYGCFELFHEDSRQYGYATTLGVSQSCEDAAVQQLLELQRNAMDLAQRDGKLAQDDFFDAEQNARLIKNAERYYRELFRGRISSWNLRDQHMAETLEALVAHLNKRIREPRVVLWAHNSHLGDARATDMGGYGEINVGQLVREAHGGDCVLVGFSTHTGTVTAASHWDGPAELKHVRPALEGSYEALFHATGLENFMLQFGTRDSAALDQELREARLQRAIGVIYKPETERQSHYYYTRLPDQFDALLHLDETRAVEPLERTAPWTGGEAPETYPFAV